MGESGPTYAVVQRRMNMALIVINVLGALVTFLYFNVISPMPEGQSPLRIVEWTDDKTKKVAQIELYDHETDPQENISISGEKPEVVKKLQMQLHAVKEK